MVVIALAGSIILSIRLLLVVNDGGEIGNIVFWWQDTSKGILLSIEMLLDVIRASSQHNRGM